MRLLFAFCIAMISLFSFTALADDESKTVWIDVRSEAEYKADHMEDSAFIPHTEIAEQIAKLNLEKSTPIKLFCRSGGRAGQAKKTLEALGYNNVENVGSLEKARELREKLEQH